MVHFFKLIRYKNLVMIAFVQLIFRFGYFKLNNIVTGMSNFQYCLLVVATVFIAAAGYVINDIFDQDTDLINKPSKVIVGKYISESSAYNIYVALNIIGVGVGFVLSRMVLQPKFFIIFILIAALLYVYATYLKQTVFLGNLVISFLAAITILIIGVFDIYTTLYEGNKAQMTVLMEILTDYAKFAFVITLIREIVKDIQDYKGDFETGLKTTAVTLGVQNTKYIAFALSILLTLYLGYYTYTYFMNNNLYYATLYMLVFVLSPLILNSIKFFSANDTKTFASISFLYKIIMFFGILSLLIVTFNIKNNG
ncbi:geranylgeranylglycerol-phosphate geranylgeranyltransferase [Flavobacterium croceum]|uniref:4-hydroxybenzoate polyprenyltransferase n=1 Tax=Flavobacterium croceum DSM 17960 TaxID=1121886 RepID=A0A2S4N654_9FLAO|nr:geranylgeranylglycerol-phosphate geranylgeranyltransferase [Flavobacterium croceum]POS01166.1 4-hydroxybenzoate polyprenyltransferase [Flavobacterium croceum DSM 17960]